MLLLFCQSAGREVVDFLQNICSNDIDCPIGHVVHTGMQNHKGGYENDCSVVQLEPNKFVFFSFHTKTELCVVIEFKFQFKSDSIFCFKFHQLIFFYYS